MSHPRLTEESDSEMKQVAQGHRATKWQSRDSLTHAAPTGAHSGPCTPARPPPPARAHLGSPPRSTPHQASDSSVLHPHNAPALHPGGCTGPGQVLPTRLPRKAGLSRRPRFHPRGFPAGPDRAGRLRTTPCPLLSPPGRGRFTVRDLRTGASQSPRARPELRYQ